MVDDSTCDDIVSWTENGTQFTIHQTNEFASELLPKYFKHRNFSSFVRQLNSYVGALAILPANRGSRTARGTLPRVSLSAHARVRLLARLCARGRGRYRRPLRVIRSAPR
jgi:hypothetical protein